jgi:type IV pilus assembly protein PilB
MGLGRLQGAIVDNLAERSHLNTGQLEELKGTNSNLNGSEFDELLIGDYRVSLHQLNVAKAKAYGVAPFNVKGLDVNRGTWEILDQEFCNENRGSPCELRGKIYRCRFFESF